MHSKLFFNPNQCIGLVIFLTFIFISCKKEKGSRCTDTTSSKIAEILHAPPKTPRTEIWEWAFQGKNYTYVTLPAVCCDTYSSELYDDQCVFLCNPDGGFSGSGDGNCSEVKAGAVKTLVWKDDR